MTMQCPGEMLNVMLQSSGMPHRQGTDLYILTKTSVGRGTLSYHRVGGSNVQILRLNSRMQSINVIR
jgi:hypothetical protein